MIKEEDCDNENIQRRRFKGALDIEGKFSSKEAGKEKSNTIFNCF